MDINSNIKKFEIVKNLKFNIDAMISNINNVSKKIVEYYQELITDYKKTVFIFGIDSLYFQNKLIEIELEHLLKIYDLILNRVYCEYYKLYKLIIEYIVNNIEDVELVNNIINRNKFPKYNDLDIYKKYNFTIIINIHEEINNILNILNNILIEKKLILNNHQEKNDRGLNITNFVNTFHFENIKYEEQVKLFDNHLNYFYTIHFKNLDRFLTKIKLLSAQINSDVNFNTTKVDDNVILDKITNDVHFDKKLQKSLRQSITNKPVLFERDDSNNSSLNDFDSPKSIYSVSSLFNDDLKNDDLYIESNKNSFDVKDSINDVQKTEVVVDKIIVEEVVVEKLVQDEIVQDEIVQYEIVVDEVIQDEVVQDEVVQDEVVQDEVVVDEVVQYEVVVDEVVVDEVVVDDVVDETIVDEVVQDEVDIDDIIQDEVVENKDIINENIVDEIVVNEIIVNEIIVDEDIIKNND